MNQRAASNYKAPVIVNDHAEYKKTTRGDKKSQDLIIAFPNYKSKAFGVDDQM